MYYLLFISLRYNTVPICPTKLKIIIIYGIESNCAILNQIDFIKISLIWFFCQNSKAVYFYIYIGEQGIW